MENKEQKTVRTLCVQDKIYHPTAFSVDVRTVTSIKAISTGIELIYDRRSAKIKNPSVTSFVGEYNEEMFVNFKKAQERHHELIKKRIKYLSECVDEAKKTLDNYMSNIVINKF